jgi:hypothetical protein
LRTRPPRVPVSSWTASSASGLATRIRKGRLRGARRMGQRKRRAHCRAGHSDRDSTLAHGTGSPRRQFAPFATATFIALKPGLLTLERARPLRRGSRCTIWGLATNANARRGHRLDWPALLPRPLPPVLARRTRNVNKGDCLGTLGILGGSGRNERRPDPSPGRAAMRNRRAARCGSDFSCRSAAKLDTGMPELMLRHAGAVLDAQPDATGGRSGASGTAMRRATLLMRALALQIPLCAPTPTTRSISSHAIPPPPRGDTRPRPRRRSPPRHPGEAGAVLARCRHRTACRTTRHWVSAARGSRSGSRRTWCLKGRGQRARPSRRHVGHQCKRRSRARHRRQRGTSSSWIAGRISRAADRCAHRVAAMRCACTGPLPMRWFAAGKRAAVGPLTASELPRRP